MGSRATGCTYAMAASATKCVGALAFREVILFSSPSSAAGSWCAAADDPPAELGDVFIHSLVAKPMRTG
jgi:hypothetical protein